LAPSSFHWIFLPALYKREDYFNNEALSFCIDRGKWRVNGQLFIVSYDSANKLEHYKKPLH